MEQESISISNKSIAVGGGPAGCACAKFLQDYGYSNIHIFEYGKILRTLLPTGGGRCNISNAQYDFKDLAKNYPRGEKFLYSIFSKFGVQETINFLSSIGIETYTQEDNRIFPTSNSSSDVRNKILNSLNCKFVKEKVEHLSKLNNGYKIITDKSTYSFDIVVVAIGGHSNFGLLKELGIDIIPPTQSLVGFCTKEDFSQLAGISIKKARIDNIEGDLLFTHKGISGPLIYTISSINAKKQIPYELNIELAQINNFQELLNQNPHKNIKNIISGFIPKSLCQYIFEKIGLNPERKSHTIDGKTRDEIKKCIESFNITITGKIPDGEVVTCGGIDLKEINPQTMELKEYPNLYCCGEVTDIDGLCGGYNLQNCWSSAYVTALAIAQKDNLH